MNGIAKIHSRHLDRQAIVYLRQSSTKQVLQNQESARNQRALTDRLRELGWNDAQVSVVDEDQGKSAAQSAGREGFQKLAADVGLGRVGIIVGYEVSRLSRNCADWHQLLELCAVFDTLIGDVDGIYHPRDFNDRLLLGLKGTMSAAELHSLRLRLDAGRLSKARRGELIQHVPTGLVRTAEGVILDPDESIRQRIHLVFEKFWELSSIRQVMLYFLRNELQLPRRQTSGLYAGQVLWKDPSAAALGSILKNPAYAGAFAYGRRQAVATRKIPGRPATGRIRQQQSDWLALIHDAWPAYISWKVHEEIQQRISQNADRMKEQCRPRSTPGKALLIGLVRCGKCGCRMSVSYKNREGRYQYCCQSAQKHYGKRTCQYLSAEEIDVAVTDAFFEALQPAEIDVLEQHSRQQADQHQQLVREQARDVQRLEYAAHRAEQQYDNVDPTNRLITATLETKWESALHAVNSARERLEDSRREPPVEINIPMPLREAFADAGKQLPELWKGLSPTTRRALVRTLITGINLLRDPDGVVQIRVVWKGRLVTEQKTRLRSFSLRGTDLEQRTVDRIRELSSRGLNSEAIANELNTEELMPCRGERFTEIIVTKLRRRFGIVSNPAIARRGNLSFAWTLSEVARQINRHPSWISRQIHNGRVTISVDATYGCYLFPKDESIIESMKALRDQKTSHVKVPKVQKNG
ncbi:MAG: recombinase family protein [Planctomycetota bacterium]|nr:recombinase family protein [Planctomycetota bacterium]